ncbi:MAG: TRAP transporter small permease [Alphaproteobacteria bacterium]
MSGAPADGQAGASPPAWLRLIHRSEEGVIALLFAALTLITFVQVVLRGLGDSIGWAFELSRYLFAWLVLFGVSYALRVGAHIGVDALVRLLPRPARRAVGLIAVGLCIAYAVLLILGAWEYIDKVWRFATDDLKVPRGLPYLIVPIGMALVLLRLVGIAWNILRDRADGFAIGDEAREALESHAATGRDETRP